MRIASRFHEEQGRGRETLQKETGRFKLPGRIDQCRAPSRALDMEKLGIKSCLCDPKRLCWVESYIAYRSHRRLIVRGQLENAFIGDVEVFNIVNPSQDPK